MGAYYSHPIESGTFDFFDPAWHTFPADWDDSMTIGIGVLCEGGKCIVLASDTRASYKSGRPHDVCAKQFDLPPFPFVGLIAGEVSCAASVVSQMCAEFREIPSPPATQLAHIIRAFNNARFHIFEERVDAQMRQYLCTGLTEWKQGPLDARVYRGGKAVIRTTKLPVHIIVAGFLRTDEFVFLRGIQKRPHEEEASPGVYVIGATEASEFANEVLRRRKQCLDFGLPRTLLHIYEAMKAARKDHSVGNPSWYVVLRPNDMMRFPSNSIHLRNWEKAYKNRVSTVSLEESAEAHRQIEMQLRVHEPKLLERDRN
jgi:hypothetical protein